MPFFPHAFDNTRKHDSLTLPIAPDGVPSDEWGLALWIANVEVWSRGLRPQTWEIESWIDVRMECIPGWG